MKFGQKLRKIREAKRISQQELARRLGYKTNSYVSDMERGKFIPSQGKLKRIAEALRTPFSKLKGLILESRLKEMGIKDSLFIDLVSDYPRLTAAQRRAIIKIYLKVKKQEERKGRYSNRKE